MAAVRPDQVPEVCRLLHLRVQWGTEGISLSDTSLESVLSALSLDDKLAALDILWRDLSAKPADLPSPHWHGDVLDARLAAPSAKPRLPLDVAIEDVKDRLNARRAQG